MNFLDEITEKDLGIDSAEEILERTFKLRKSARGVVLNKDNDVSIQFVGKKNYYKLPGGGVEVGETVEGALRREIIEEVGCNISIENNLGITIEYRTQHDLLHISYGFIARVVGEVGEPTYEQGEIEDDFKPLWVPLNKALKLIDPKQEIDDYRGKFIVRREHAFLTEAKRVLAQ